MNTEISIEKYVPKKYRHCVDEFFKVLTVVGYF